jgi:hypothetical protein
VHNDPAHAPKPEDAIGQAPRCPIRKVNHANTVTANKLQCGEHRSERVRAHIEHHRMRAAAGERPGLSSHFGVGYPRFDPVPDNRSDNRA